MILVELQNTDDLPTVRQVSPAHFVRLAVVYAYRAGLPLPVTVDEAVSLIRQNTAALWAFYSLESADLWAESYTGPQADMVRYLVRDHVASHYMPAPAFAFPEVA